jgi:YebC/PmpR family DNA-binding regulatory protein
MGRAFEYRKARIFKRNAYLAKTFTRLGKEITMAAKAGGPDPEQNSKLRLLIQTARNENMPKDNIDRAIKRAFEKDMSDYKEMVYEGRGPHGIAILIEAATDNNQRTVANVRSYFNKFGGSLGTSGMLDFLFDHKCIFTVARTPELDIEEFELAMMDFDAEIDADDEEVIVIAEYKAFGPIQKYLEDNGYEIESSEFERIPNDTKELTAEERADVEKLIDKLEEDEDVQNVFHNMKEDDEAEA